MKNFVKQNLLLFLTFGAVVLSVIIGALLKMVKTWDAREAMYLSFLGTIYLRVLRCLIVPLIFPTIITAVGDSSLAESKAVAWRAGLYYLGTSILAMCTSLTFSLLIRPGTRVPKAPTTITPADNKTNTLSVDIYLDLIRNIFPDNIITATFRSSKTDLVFNQSEPDPAKWDFKVNDAYEATNMIGLVVSAIAVGISMKLGDQLVSVHLLEVCRAVSSAAQVLVERIVWFTPVGVASLLISDLVSQEDLVGMMASLSWYLLTVAIIIFVHGFLLIPLVFFLVCRKNPYKLLLGMKDSLVAVFSTASSMAGLPKTMRCLTSYGAQARVVNLCIPVGSTIMMDGSALYEGSAVIFLAQMENDSLSFNKCVSLVVAAVLCSIGVAIPNALVVIIMTVLKLGQISIKNLPIILIMDWLIDRFRTVTNVYGNALVVVAINTRLLEKEAASAARRAAAADESKQDPEIVAPPPPPIVLT